MSSEDFSFREDELTLENMVEFGKMWLKAIDALHKKTGNASLSNVKIKIVEAVTGLSPQAGLALRATLTSNIVSGSIGGQFNTTPPPLITGESQAAIQTNLAEPVDSGSFLEPGQGNQGNPTPPANTGEHLPPAEDNLANLAASFGKTANDAVTSLTGEGAKEGEETLESRTDFFLNNSPTNIAAKYTYEQLQHFAIALGLTIEPSHRAQQVAAIIKAKLKESK